MDKNRCMWAQGDHGGGGAACPGCQGLRVGPEPCAEPSGAGEPDGSGGTCLIPKCFWWEEQEQNTLGTSPTSVFMVPGMIHGLCTCLTHSSNLDFLICLV